MTHVLFGCAPAAGVALAVCFAHTPIAHATVDAIGAPATSTTQPNATNASNATNAGTEANAANAPENAPNATNATNATNAPTTEVGETGGDDEIESWGAYDAGKGYLVGRTSLGELSLSAYGLFRYINQLPGEQTFVDHLGVVRKVDTRNDFGFHRGMLHFMGWAFIPMLRYQFTVWTVNATEQIRLIGNLSYRFHKAFNLYGGIAGLPGTRTMLGSHPYWLGHDRMLADEYFRPGFTSGVWANGELLPGFFYDVMVGNNISTLGVSAAEDTRNLAVGATVWWMPTTHEFGPKGGTGDFEDHAIPAIRVGASGTHSREDRFNEITSASVGPESTQIHTQDSLLLFQTSALAPNVTLQNADYALLAADAGLKWQGLFLQTEFYNRWLYAFSANGPLPVRSIDDWGFYVEGSVFALPQTLELYAGTSFIFGDPRAGYKTSYDVVAGANFYPFKSRNHRIDLQAIAVDRSPASSVFGYYVGGQRGVTVSLDASLLF